MMYKQMLFDNYEDLVEFLNTNKIKKTNIIKITDPTKFGLFHLIYME